MAQPIQLRHGTASQWTTANPILQEGEVGVEVDTAKLKIGNGVSAYASLSYVAGGGGGGGATSYVGLSDAGSVDLTTVNSPLFTALGLLAPKASPTFTGTPLAPTAAAATNTTQIATTAHVFAERSNAATLTGKTMSGSSNTFSALPASGISGVIPIANLATGTPTGSKYIRDDGTLQAIPGGGDAVTSGTLGQFASTTSAQLATVLSDETGTGVVVFSASPALTGTPTAPTAAAATNTTQLATTAHVFAERSNTFTLTNKTLTSPTLTTPAFSGTMTGTATLPATVTMAASPSQADNSLKVATTAYVDTLGATKVTINAAVALTSTNTLTQASHFNRHLSWTGASTAAQAISATATAGDFVELSNDGTADVTFTGITAATGFKLSAKPGETFYGVYTNGAWKSITPVTHLETLVLAIGDETTAITTGTAKVTFRMPWAMTVTAVRASLTTASSSGIPTFDINEGGTTIISTKLTIDASEKTSTTAATPAVISDSALADDAEITVDVDVAGTGAAGAKIYIYGVRA